MHDAKPQRTLSNIDRDLHVERALLEYEARNGRKSDGTCATWRHIDSLLDERLLRMVPGLPDQPPSAVDGHLVSETKE